MKIKWKNEPQKFNLIDDKLYNDFQVEFEGENDEEEKSIYLMIMK